MISMTNKWVGEASYLNVISADGKLVERKKGKVKSKGIGARKGYRFFHVSWPRYANAMVQLGTDKASRLLAVLYLQKTLEGEEWIQPRRSLLAEVGLNDAHFCKYVSRLEVNGLVEVRRNPGKRPFVRLLP
jgi:hypothetical protein